jgi:hypothetical protein
MRFTSVKCRLFYGRVGSIVHGPNGLVILREGIEERSAVLCDSSAPPPEHPPAPPPRPPPPPPPPHAFTPPPPGPPSPTPAL